MNNHAIWLILAVGFCYFLLTVIMPAVFFYRYIKAKPFVVRFAFYQVTGNAYMIFWGFLFSYLNIWNQTLTLFIMIFLPLLAKLLIFRRDLIHLLIDYIKDKRERLVTVPGTLKNLRLWAGKKIKDAYFRYIHYHYAEIIFLIAIIVFVVWYYGFFKLYNFTFASPDEATHLYWVNAMFGKNPFPVGLYPHSLHFTMASIYSVSGLQTLIINHYFSVIIAVMIHVMIFCAVKALFRSSAAAIGSAGFFLLADMFVSQRYHNTLPMEYGFIAMLAMIILLNEFMKRREKLFMWMAAIATGWTFHTHFYITIMCAFIWIAFLVVYLKTIIRLKAVLKTLLAIFLAIVIAIAPFGIGLAAGFKFEQSVDWALTVMGVESEESIITTSEQNDIMVEKARENANPRTDADPSSGETSVGKTEDDSKETENKKPEEEKKELTPYVVEFKNAQSINDVMRALAHLLMVRVIRSEQSARLIFYLIFFGIIYGIAKIVISNLSFRKRKKELLEEGITKKEYRKRKQEYMSKDGFVLVVPLFLLFTIFCYSMSFLGFPMLIDDARAAMILSPLLAFSFAAPLACISDLLRLIPVRNKLILELSFLIITGAGLTAFFAKGPIKKLEEVNCYAVTQELSNELSYELIATLPNNTWTVISPVYDLLPIHYYGYHYEVIDLIREIENGETDIAMPTNDLYVVVEKKIMNAEGVYYLPDYHEEVKEGSMPVDKALIDLNFYDLELPWRPAEEAYLEFRQITMSKLYYWMEEIKKAYPNEVEVHSENDVCIVYHVRQSADFPINLCRDFRVEAKGVNFKEDFERRYAEEHGLEYEEDKH